jgi:prepilin-type processing-associated H-X9-DG protein
MQTIYLQSGGKANCLYYDGKLTTIAAPKNSVPDGFTYEPKNPVTFYGGNVCYTGNAIQGGAFDQRDRNLNTGGNNYDEKEGVVANNLIFHSAQYPSQLRLPIVKR